MSKEIYRWLILLVLILALALRLISLNQSLWHDEAITALAVKNNSPWELINNFALGDTHPPLYYLILDFWTSIFGYSEISLRFPSVIFGLVTVYVIYKLGEHIKGSRIGLFAALLLATNPLHIYYSQDARMYSLTTLLVSLIILLFLKARWLWLSIALLVLGMSDYMPLVILVPLWGIALLSQDRKRMIFKLFFAHIPLFLFSLWWAPSFLIQQESTMSYVQSFPEWRSVLGGSTLKELILVWVKFLIGRIGFESNLLYGFVVCITSIAPFILGVRSIFMNESKKVLLIVASSLSIIFFASFFVSGFSYFRILFLLPLFLLLLSFPAKNVIFMPLVSLIVASNIIFTSIYLFDSQYWREDWKSLVYSVEAKLKEDETVLMSYREPFDGYEWYSKKFDQTGVFTNTDLNSYQSLYTLDYLMDLTDKDRLNYQTLNNLGFQEKEVVSFRGVGQVRFWQKE